MVKEIDYKFKNFSVEFPWNNNPKIYSQPSKRHGYEKMYVE